MDKTIKITLGLFLIVLAGFAATIVYGDYVETSYRNSLMSTYSYTGTITTDASLTNVTFFIPVPVDSTGNSPMVTHFSAHDMDGMPSDWKTALFDTGKATLLKITTPAIIPPEGTSAARPYTITFSLVSEAKKPIDTKKPFGNSVMYRPVQDLSTATCQPADTTGTGSPQCSVFVTSVYADYLSSPGAMVTVRSTLSGKNSWTIFESQSNTYHAEFSAIMHGENHGWVVASGTLATGIGSFDTPSLT
jgi:hypothetical protein